MPREAKAKVEKKTRARADFIVGTIDFPMVRLLLSADGGPLIPALTPLPLYACRGRGCQWIYYYIYHDAGLVLGHQLQNPITQDPTVFGCGSATTFILRIPDI